MFNVQRAITPNIGKPELRLICFSCCLMMFYICVNILENITNGIRVMERTHIYGRNQS